MAQESGSQNKTTEFLLKNQITIIVVALLAILAIIFFVTRGDDSTSDNNDTRSEQNGTQDNGSPSQTPTPAPTAGQPQPEQGNVMASGTLRQSDNAAKGNLMVESDQGKVYIATKRDFSALLGTTVTLNANGTLNNFEFLGFNEASEVADEPTGEDDGVTAGAVTFNGILRKSDQPSLGNYMVTSGSTAVYYQSARDYSAWVGSNVHLEADGSLDSFTNGVLHKR